LSDDWAYKELVQSIVAEEQEVHRPADRLEKLNPYELVIVDALDSALETTGRSATEVIYGFLEQRHGLLRTDIVRSPGRYISGLRDLFGTACQTIESLMLRYIEDKLGVRAHTIEEAVFQVRKTYGDTRIRGDDEAGSVDASRSWKITGAGRGGIEGKI